MYIGAGSIEAVRGQDTIYMLAAVSSILSDLSCACKETLLLA